MAMTAEVKDELSRLIINSVSARRAEVASLLRFAGGLHIVAGRVVDFSAATDIVVDPGPTEVVVSAPGRVPAAPAPSRGPVRTPHP